MTTEQNKGFGEMIAPEELTEDVIKAKLLDAMTPGFQAEFDPEEADEVGAFIEDALSEEDAMASDIDLLEPMNPDTEGR
jgi:hypothetical protein